MPAEAGIFLYLYGEAEVELASGDNLELQSFELFANFASE